MHSRVFFLMRPGVNWSIYCINLQQTPQVSLWACQTPPRQSSWQSPSSVHPGTQNYCCPANTGARQSGRKEREQLDIKYTSSYTYKIHMDKESWPVALFLWTFNQFNYHCPFELLYSIWLFSPDGKSGSECNHITLLTGNEPIQPIW